jgi:hypothetical protein
MIYHLFVLKRVDIIFVDLPIFIWCHPIFHFIEMILFYKEIQLCSVINENYSLKKC